MANNTTGGSWWKQAVEWGTDIFDDVYDWGDSFLSSTPDIPTLDYSDFKSTTGIGGRGINIPGANQMKTPSSENEGWSWWDTAKKYAGYADEYVIDPARKALGYGRDIYDALPKGLQDAIMGKGGDTNKEKEGRPRAKPGSLRADMSSVARQISRGQTGKFNPQNLYGRNSPTGSVMYQAMKEQQIKEAMLKQINTGSKTISLTQAKDIYTYLSRRG